MVRWRVEYQGPDKKMRTTYVNAPDTLASARDVQNAIERGELANISIPRGRF
jgi:hypothetical protein